jgi:hypothetical protein
MTALRRVAFNRGQIDRLLAVREDLEGLQAACTELINYRPLPQGALKSRDGLLHVDWVRGPLETVAFTGATATAPNGGDAAALLAGTGPLTTTTVMAGSYVLATVTFAAPVAVSVWDVTDLAVLATGGGDDGLPPPPGGWTPPGGGDYWDNPYRFGIDVTGDGTDAGPVELSGALQVQYLAGGVWTRFGAAVSVGSVIRSRRIGPGPGAPVTAAAWRLVVDCAGLAGYTDRIVRLAGLGARVEDDVAAPVRLRPISLGLGATGVAVITPGNVEIYEGGTRVASAAIPLASGSVNSVDVSMALDTMIVTHPTMEPQALMRQGSGFDWDWRAAQIKDVPVFDFRGDRAGGVSEVQLLRFANYATGDTFNLTVEDDVTGTIIWNGAAATATAVQTALEALPVLGAGSVLVAAEGTTALRVTFQGDARNLDWGEIVPKTITSSTGGIVTATITQGKAGGEAKWSAARGWPATSAFHAQRLWLAGHASLPETVNASRTGDYYSFRVGNRDDSAIDITLDTSELTRVHRLFPGRSLMLFTSAGEFWWSNEPVSATAPGVRLASRHGIMPWTQPAELDGAVCFVAASGNEVLTMGYDDGVAAFTATSLSVLAGSLVSDIRDMAVRSRPSSADPDEILCVLGSDRAAACSVQRGENVAGWWTFQTAGQLLAVTATQSDPMWFAVSRAGRVRLERQDPRLATDGAHVTVVSGDPISSVTGLAHLNGLTVAAIIDGRDEGNVAVIDGVASLPHAASARVELGLVFSTLLASMPLANEQQGREGLSRWAGLRRGRAGARIRTGSVELRVKGTAVPLEVRGAGSRWWPLSLRRLNDLALDRAVEADGWGARIDALPGHDNDGIVQIRCERPGAHMIQAMSLMGDA